MWIKMARIASGLLSILLLYGGTAHTQSIQPSLQSFHEVMLKNGSSYVILKDSLELGSGALVGFSFRTCSPQGVLFRQLGESTDLVKLSLSQAGGLILTIESGEERRLLEAGSNLADGAWHTVRLGVSPNLTTLCLSVDGSGPETECLPARTGPTVVSGGSTFTLSRLEAVQEILSNLNLAGPAGQLRVGSGLVGCIREGPGIRFTSERAVRDDFGVEWSHCFLPDTCQGYDWTTVASISQANNPCSTVQCEAGGLCLPLANPPAGQADTTCVCPPGLTGEACETGVTNCSEDPCLHGGQCSQDTVSGGFVCNCSSTGYSGTYCEVELNRCTGTVCENGGTCLDQPGGFLCQCPPGFYGFTCSNVIPTARSDPTPRNIDDPCLAVPAPCANGGVCTSSNSVITCNCRPGYTGSTCANSLDPCGDVRCLENSECRVTSGGSPMCFCATGYTDPDNNGRCTKIDYCLENPCNNGGTCTQTETFFTCVCPPGREGRLCDQEGDPCSPSPCLNGGQCSGSTGADYRCSCPVGFTGRNCEEDIDECAQSPCDHGTCQNQAGGYSCSCEAGWRGQLCEINVDECASNPCLNNATCTDKVNGYDCNCVKGYTGTNCQEDINECLSSPCLNAGTCIDGIDNFTCICPTRYMGLRCESPYDACASSPCLNGAQCTKTSDERGAGTEYECQCVEGYEGERCEVNIDDCVGVECSENQTCVDLVNSYECRCPLGFQGPTCGEEIDECATNPCKNGATCTDMVGNYTCTCPAGYQGLNCDEDVDECEVSPGICNNGVCKNLNGSYQCYCTPGYAGTHCTYEFDECLYAPCKNGGTCQNLVNSYSCTCPPGFNGTNCENDIDECLADPCQNGATCIDGINNYTCACVAGYTGYQCGINIDDCASAPCLHGGMCSDGVNEYACNCTHTGFVGDNCEIDIDECEILPCQNNATCQNLINDYSCICWPGYEGKNCSTDIQECAEEPCQNNGTCFEPSNLELYQDPSVLPENIRDFFSLGFDYANASGYMCSCLPGFTGVDCDINIDECESNPCENGAECIDGINEYICACKPGFEGDRCEVDINECEKYSPCQNDARCIEYVADYECVCKNGFGGKNCSVPLIGCEEVTCLNGGTCHPWLVGEDDHRGNCTCMPGFDGDVCQITTTFSFKGDSHVSVDSDRIEGFELSLRFRTTLSNGLVALGHSPSFFRLNLFNGRLNLHSSMLNNFEGIFIGESLNDTKWQKVYVAFNISHLTIGLNDRLQAIHPINPETSNQTAFGQNFLGGVPTDPTLNLLVDSIPDFVGCMQDISVNGIKVTEEDVRKTDDDTVESGIRQFNTEKGCYRKDQCKPNPCENEGSCTDLWRNYKCYCHRPFLGPSCQYNYTGATFGHENTTNSQVVVKVQEPNDYKQGIDLSMFIRTRKPTGIIFYLGVDPASPIKNQIIGRLVDGKLQVEARFSDKKPEYFTLYSAQLANGHRHFIRVTRMKNLMTVKVNDTISIKQEISSVVPIEADYLYLGNLVVTESSTLTTTVAPVTSTSSTTRLTTTTTTETTTTTTTQSTTSSLAEAVTTIEAVEETTLPTTDDNTVIVTTEQADGEPTNSLPVLSREIRQVTILPFDEEFTFFKGVIQDVQLSNGISRNKIVQLFELDFTEDVVVEDSLGDVSSFAIEKGVVTDNTCRINPCQNDGICHVTWNDYSCECQPGFKGENCDEIEYCYWNQCPEGSSCNTLIDGHECVTNATFNGVNNTIVYDAQFSYDEDVTSVTATFRTKSDGTLLHIQGEDDNELKIMIVDGQVETILPVYSSMKNFTFGNDIDDGEWHKVQINSFDGIVRGYIDGENVNDYYLDGNETDLDMFALMTDATIVLGSAYGDGYADYFRGCAGEVRIGSVLLPYFTETELVNNTVRNKFVISESVNITKAECVLCYEHECENSGVCRNPAEKFECDCQPGFDGATCAVDIDECENNDCENGECVDGVNDYKCMCYTGWTGQFCNIDKDECEDAPCKNGGICEQTVEPGNYVCTCTDEYKGKNCEDLKVRTCNEEPCSNGATCIPRPQSTDPDRFTCDCPQGYEGQTCESKINFCVKLNANCQNGGTCRSDFSSFNYECLCENGFTGKNCETNIDDCAEMPCKNNATCIDMINRYSCDCKDTGFMGSTCEENINECLNSPCQNGARCNDTIGDYQCVCSDRYCGKNCQQMDPCLKNPDVCGEEGKCVPSCDIYPFYICDCSLGFEGPNCDIKVGYGYERSSSDPDDYLLLIVAPLAAGLIFVSVVGLVVFVSIARKRRSEHGTYNPQKLELQAPRLELDLMLKPPNEERLI